MPRPWSTNLLKATDSTITVGTNGNKAAQEFNVPDADPDQDYVLTAVTVNIDRSGNNFRMAIHGKSGSNPGDQIYSLNGPSSPGTGVQTYTAPAGATLENGKSYFLVIRGGSSGTRVRRTESDDQSGLSGWGIANRSLTGANSWNQSSDILKMTVNGFALLDADPLTLTARAVAPMRVTLQWNRTLPALKTIDRDDGYRIEWSPDGSTSWMSLVNDTNQHGTFDLWCTCYPTKFNDDTIEPGETRYYRIQAVDDDKASVYSNVVSATTPGLVDSDGGLIEFGAVESQLDAVNDQKVFRIRLESGEYRFTIRGAASKYRVVVTDAGGTEIENFVLESGNGPLTEDHGAEHGRAPSQDLAWRGFRQRRGTGELEAGQFQFTLLPVREESAATLSLPDKPTVTATLNTYGDVDTWGVAVQPGEAYAVRVRGREDGRGTAATPGIRRANPPGIHTHHRMDKPWVDGVTMSEICAEHGQNSLDCEEFQAFVIDLRGLTGAQQTFHISLAPTQRPDTRPYREGTYEVDLRQLSSGQLQGVRMPLRAWFASQPAQHDGSKRFKVQVGFSDALDGSPEQGVEVEGGEVTSVRPAGGNASGGAAAASPTTRLVGGPDGEVVWEFEIEPDSDGDVTVSLPERRPCDDSGAICTADGRVLSQGDSTTVRGPGDGPAPNTPAAGAPTIGGTPQVGEELTASASEVSDADGLDDASFAYQSIRTDTDIEGATGSTYTVADADEGETLKVRVGFTDDAGNEESLTSAATGVVAAAPELLTASFENVPSEHDGETAFRFRVAFSEPIAISFRSLREDAFETTGGRVTRGTRVDGRKDLFEITVEPDGDGELTIALPAGRDCAVSGAICTWGPPRKRLTNTTTATVAGPSDGGPEPNSPATGAPAIAGTPQVGDELTASTSDISDADGLADARFDYQWIRADSDISGATGSAYTAVAADEGERLKVRVSFTDDAGNAESLTSTATDAVTAAAAAAATNTPAAGAPTISGTPQVDETLTASTSGYLRRRRAGECAFRLPVDPRGERHSGGDRRDLYGGGGRRRRAAEGAGQLHRRRRQHREPDERGDRCRRAEAEHAGDGSADDQRDAAGRRDADRLDVGHLRRRRAGRRAFRLPVDPHGESDIQEATGSTYTAVEADEGERLKVRVSFTDDAGNAESLTSTATEAVAARPVPLTASFKGMPAEHTGDEFTFGLVFSEHFPLSYRTLRDEAFEVGGGAVLQREPPGVGEQRGVDDHGRAGRPWRGDHTAARRRRTAAPAGRSAPATGVRCRTRSRRRCRGRWASRWPMRTWRRTPARCWPSR